MGNNFDRKTWFFSYKPLPRLLLTGRFDNIRKGGPGTLLQQYFSEPQPSFLFDYQWKSVEASVNARYEIIHQVYATAQYYYKQQRFYANISNPLQTVQQLQLGLNIGW
jgi:hypothetical protein